MKLQRSGLGHGYKRNKLFWKLQAALVHQSDCLQNAEDTDRATRFSAVLEFRQNASVRVRPEGGGWRKRLQGAAMVFYDDGVVSAADAAEMWDDLALDLPHSKEVPLLTRENFAEGRRILCRRRRRNRAQPMHLANKKFMENLER